jgi:hypothetical protein
MYQDRSKKIKKALLKGGLVIASRASGKTKALAEILAEIPEAMVIFGVHAEGERIKKFLIEEYGLNKSEVNKKVIHGLKAKELLLGRHRDFLGKYVYVDEYYLNPYKENFKAAVTSFPFPVKIIV